MGRIVGKLFLPIQISITWVLWKGVSEIDHGINVHVTVDFILHFCQRHPVEMLFAVAKYPAVLSYMVWTISMYQFNYFFSILLNLFNLQSHLIPNWSTTTNQDEIGENG